MSASVHVAAGTIIGSFLSNPIIGFFAGLGSHLILDLIPHKELFTVKRELWAVLILSLVLLPLAWVWGKFVPVFMAGLGAVLPDVEILCWKWNKLSKEKLLFPTHTSLLPQRESKRGFIFVLQIFIICASLGLFISGVV